MAVPVFKHYFSAEDVRALPDDGRRYETVYGELLVSPSPRTAHQRVLSRLQAELVIYLRRHELEGVLASPADISFSDNTLVQPDLFVVSHEAFAAEHWEDMRPIYLAVEVLSPPSDRADRFTKRRLYQEHRIPAYWVVDTEARVVEVWTPDVQFPTIVRDRCGGGIRGSTGMS
jgi:Uma2 family endonuclease